MSIDFRLSEINLEFIKFYQADKIRNILLKYPENKIAIFDEAIPRIFNPIFKTEELKKFNVEEMFYTNSFKKYSNKYYVYFVLPTEKSISFIIQNKKFLMDNSNKHIVCFVGTRDIAIEYDLNCTSIWDYVVVEEIDIEVVPVEYDCLNMNMQLPMWKLFVNKNVKFKRKMAKCIEIIQRTHGLIEDIVSIGDVAEEIKTMVMNDNLIHKYDKISKIKKVIIFDRMVDTITPCLSQVTYEGMVDDFFSIKNGSVMTGNKQILLNSTYEFYNNVRDKHINIFDKLLKSHVECSNMSVKIMHNDTDTDKETIKYIAGIAKSRKLAREYLGMHVALKQSLCNKMATKFYKESIDTEQQILTIQESDNMIKNMFGYSVDETKSKIFNFIEKSIKHQQFEDLIGLISLYFQMYGKMDMKKYDNLITQLTDKYDCHYIINHMEKLGLMDKKNIRFNINGEPYYGPVSFRKCVKEYNLIKDIDFNQLYQTDLCYLYGGFAPISGKIIESMRNPNEITLVCFVGGCNYTEIAACRTMGNCIVLTTNIFNKTNFFYFPEIM